ncbi:hypothetical protein [Weissella paramesenteroides]|uniref:hypothetical protein n=1 Tax=Weissella paramesenteroides TaxID=1249 RepID=UPI0002F62751|nr:hypothetical protein [Weissella paramesenteroides]
MLNINVTESKEIYINDTKVSLFENYGYVAIDMANLLFPETVISMLHNNFIIDFNDYRDYGVDTGYKLLVPEGKYKLNGSVIL